MAYAFDDETLRIIRANQPIEHEELTQKIIAALDIEPSGEREQAEQIITRLVKDDAIRRETRGRAKVYLANDEAEAA